MLCKQAKVCSASRMLHIGEALVANRLRIVPVPGLSVLCVTPGLEHAARCEAILSQLVVGQKTVCKSQTCSIARQWPVRALPG